MLADSDSAAPVGDAYMQNFTLVMPDGTPFQSSMADIDFFREYGIRLGINYGTQIGASIILLGVLLLLTRKEKRTSWIFIMNTLCLVTNAIRSIVQCLYLTGPYYNFYALLSGDFSHVTKPDQANTIAANTLVLVLELFVFTSLTLQVWIVCVTTPRFQRFIILFATTTGALVAVGYRLAVTIISNNQTLKNDGMESYQHLLTSLCIAQAVAIWAYCAIFTYNLGHALLQRRRLGMTQFGPMQIIFIMGCQTMVIPAIFSALQFYDGVPELGSQTLTMVCIFLPLSAIWAGVVTNKTSLGSSGLNAHQRLLREHFGRSAAASPNSSRTGKATTIESQSTFHDKHDPESPYTPTFAKEKDVHGHGIHVDCEWNVDVDEGSGSGRSHSAA